MLTFAYGVVVAGAAVADLSADRLDRADPVAFLIRRRFRADQA